MSNTSMTPLPSAEMELIEEALSEIFEMAEQKINQKEKVEESLKVKVAPHIFDRLIKDQLISVQSDSIVFLERGEQMAAQVIRRKRLAERLMKDVLSLSEDVIDSAACQWEHVLSKEVTNSICTLLGHPTFSPREMPIPTGECCKKETTAIKSVICTLDHLNRGDEGKITYLLLKQNPELNRLLSMGLTPGSRIKMIQRVPTFVVQINETQLAFDNTIAEAIFVHPL